MMNTDSISNVILSLVTVQPVPAPFSTRELSNNNINDGGNNQNEILFNLGKAIKYINGRVFNSYLLIITNEFRLYHPVNVTGRALVSGLLLV